VMRSQARVTSPERNGCIFAVIVMLRTCIVLSWNKWVLGIVRLGMYGCGLLMWSPGWVCNWLLAASDLADDVMDMLRVDDNQKVGMNGASF